MFDVALHVGIEHPNLLWLLVTGLLTFGAGFGLGARSGRVRQWFAADADASAE